MSPKIGCKKLVLVSATSLLVTKATEEAGSVGTAGAGKNGEKSENGNFTQILCIRYLITFRKKSVLVLVFLNLDSEVNTIHLTFAKKLSLPIRYKDVGAQKIDNITLDTY